MLTWVVGSITVPCCIFLLSFRINTGDLLRIKWNLCSVTIIQGSRTERYASICHSATCNERQDCPWLFSWAFGVVQLDFKKFGGNVNYS